MNSRNSRRITIQATLSGGTPSSRFNALARNEFSQDGQSIESNDVCVRSSGWRTADFNELIRCRPQLKVTQTWRPRKTATRSSFLSPFTKFRTPASVVSGYLRMLQRDTDSTLSDRQRKMIDEAERSCARLVAIVGELSDVAKLDAGLVKLAQQPTDAFALVAEVAGLVHEARDRDVRFEVRGEAEGATMSGDATRLRSAFDAIFRAILREKPGQCLVVAERRIASGRRPALGDRDRGGRSERTSRIRP